MAKIICIDDEPALLQVYKDELSEEGYSVILATRMELMPGIAGMSLE